MKRKEWTFGWVVVALLVSLVVAPLAGAVTGEAPRVEVPLAEEGDDDDQGGDGPNRLAMYWPGAMIWLAGDREAVAQEVLDRGFTHVVNSPFNLDEHRERWFSAKGFKVVQDITPKKFESVAITPRYSSPYAQPAVYADKLASLEAYLLSRADDLVGIADDIELYPWPTKTYDRYGGEQVYPLKVPIANSPDDYGYRIGTLSAGSSWTTFKDHPSAGYHDVPELTIENVEYNFPQLSISHEVVNGSLNLGYYAPPPATQVGRIAQTFRPEHDRIARIDVLVARHGGGGSGFPLGEVYFYLTETTADGQPDESRRLYAVDLRFLSTETDYDAAGDFTGIAPLSLYFDPQEHGVLDTTKTYALVLEYRGQAYPWSDDRAWYVVAADATDGYGDGESFRGLAAGQWASFAGTDLWFKVYYPDPPSGWGVREFHEDWVDFQTDVMRWHVEDYVRILNAVNATKDTSIELYVYSGYSGPFVDWKGRIVGNLHGGFNTRAFYSINWDKLASAGLDYAVCGFGQQPIDMTLADLAGRAVLVGGVQNQADFTDRWWQCKKKAMLWYRGTSYQDDPGVVVPRGRSPGSIP